jgi:Holliday junction resolvase-like predicted endonuclease
VNNSSAMRTAAIERAASAIEAAKLQVLDRDWSSGRHHLDLVTTPGGDILAAVQVRTVPYETPGPYVTALTEDRFCQVTDALRAWAAEQGACYEDLWVIVVTVDPGAGIAVSAENAAGVA